VVDFYAATPLGSFEGSVPERFAAKDLSDQLVGAGAGRIAVVSRRVVRQAEISVGWRTEDALRFDRLQTVARVIGADQLIVGWITLLTVDGGADHGGPTIADASMGDGGTGHPSCPLAYRAGTRRRPDAISVMPTPHG
jgi:hypothetical protein